MASRCTIRAKRFIRFCSNGGSPTASYDIRTGVSEGNGGTSVASGTSVPAQVVATGRNAFGYNEYTVAVSFSALNLPPGTYWANVTPDCTDQSDSTCSSGRMFLSNTTQQTNAVHGMQQLSGQQYANGLFGSWANWCDSSFGLNAQQCQYASFGASGTVNH
jgi:hypothetical protein